MVQPADTEAVTGIVVVAVAASADWDASAKAAARDSVKTFFLNIIDVLVR